MSQGILLSRDGLHPRGWGIALALALLLQAGVVVQAQTFEWAKSGNTNIVGQGHAIAVDCAGNSYVTGFFEDETHFDGITLTSAGARDIFVAKYNADGEVEWAKSAGGIGADEGFGIAVDGAGNCYVTGTFEADATFDPIDLPKTSVDDVRDIFVVKYDADGNVVWAKGAGGALATLESHGIAVDRKGNSYVTGRFNLTATFGSTSLTSAGATDIFVAKYNTSGNVVWATSVGGADDDEAKGIAVDGDGNSHVTGFFTGEADFDDFTLASTDGSADIFVAKYDADGNVEWVKSAGGSGEDTGQGIAADGGGNSYVSGNFEEEATFDAITLTGAGLRDIFVAKYDADGNLVWAKSAGGPDDDSNVNEEVNDVIAIDGSGNSYVTSMFQSTANFDAITLTSAGSGDVFVVKYDASGNVVWAKSAGGSGDDIGFGIAVDGSGNSYVTGLFQEEADFDETTLATSAAEEGIDFFVAKLNPPPQPFVFLADKLVKINQNQKSDGDIHSNGKIEFGVGAPGTHTGNLSALDDITIRNKNSIKGEVTAGDDLYLFGNAKVNGTKDDHASVDPILLPSLSFTAGGKNVTVAKGGSKALAPGSYNQVQVLDKGKLYLSSGDYYFNILDIKPAAVLSIEVSECPVNIHVVNDLEFADKVKVKITGAGAATDKVTFITLQDPKIDIGKSVVLQGSLIAQNAEVHFSTGDKFKGSVCANTITVDAKVAFSFHSPGVLTKEVDEEDEEVTSEQSPVTSYQLEQNYPNPFNPSTQIAFSVKEAGDVQLSIYNLQGQEVRTLVSGQMNPGHHAITWNGRDNAGKIVPSGIYFYKLRVNEYEQTRKMTLMK